MIRSFHVPRSKIRRVTRPLMVVLVSACMVQQISAQRSLSPSTAAQLPSRMAAAARLSSTKAGFAKDGRGASARPTLFWVAPFESQTPDPVRTEFAEAVSAMAVDPIGDSLGSLPGMGFRDRRAFGLGGPPSGGFDVLGAGGIYWARQTSVPLFPLPWIMTHGLGGNATGRSSSSLFSLAALNRMIRGDVYVPFGSSVGGLRLDYQDNLRGGPKMTGLSGPAASAMFTSALMRNGMTLSAGALFGVRSTAFPGSGFHSLASVAQRSTVPSLGLRLSF